ncbi:hypothetical protein M0804_002641 [Polistes exclamans]|nr:hypothetical protein M0804_002641 [Polistes exclamans]
MSGLSEIKLPVLYTKGSSGSSSSSGSNRGNNNNNNNNNINGTKPKNKSSTKRMTASKSIVQSVDGCTGNGSLETVQIESSFPSPVRSRSAFCSPRKVTNQNLDSTTIKKSPKRCVQLDERHCSLNSSNRSPRRRELSFSEDFDQDEMGLTFDFYSRNAENNEPCLSFLKFESLYTMEKQMLMHSIPLLEGKDVFLGSRRGLYTELPDSDPLIQQRQYHQQQIGPIGPANKVASQFPMEGFSYAPGWALNADHFYQWQHRGKTTQQVVNKVRTLITI